MIKKLALLIALAFQLQNIIANSQRNVGEIPLYDRIPVEVNMTYAFKKICTLVSKESMEKFNNLLKDYCHYIVTLPDFNELFNEYEDLYKTYRNFTGKPLTLTIHFGFNEKINFAKNLICTYRFKKRLTYSQKEELKRAEKDLIKLRYKLLYSDQFSSRNKELHNEIGIELGKCNIPISSVVIDISLF